MNRLFNDNACETPNDLGHHVSTEIRNIMIALIKDAIDCKMSLRDLQTIVFEEVSLLCAEERLRLGIKERTEVRKRKQKVVS